MQIIIKQEYSDAMPKTSLLKTSLLKMELRKMVGVPFIMIGAVP